MTITREEGVGARNRISLDRPPSLPLLDRTTERKRYGSKCDSAARRRPRHCLIANALTRWSGDYPGGAGRIPEPEARMQAASPGGGELFRARSWLSIHGTPPIDEAVRSREAREEGPLITPPAYAERGSSSVLCFARHALRNRSRSASQMPLPKRLWLCYFGMQVVPPTAFDVRCTSRSADTGRSEVTKPPIKGYAGPGAHTPLVADRD
ncbi:hypothetical protein B0H11DRAFT_2219582 [Mycena galericulata]|nr:hypothetical protein B0H11DRAFT_2219582 [Mycena galericulata]